MKISATGNQYKIESYLMNGLVRYKVVSNSVYVISECLMENEAKTLVEKFYEGDLAFVKSLPVYPYKIITPSN